MPPTLRSPLASDDVHERVRAQQTVMLFEQTSVASVAATVFALALAAHLHGAVSNGVLGLWLALKLAAVLPRFVLNQMFKRRHDDSPRWLVWGHTLLFFDGLTWGLASVLLLPGQGVAATTVVVATLAGICAVAAFVLHVNWRACVAYVTPILLPASFVLLLRGDGFGAYGGITVLGFLALLLRAAHRSGCHVSEMLTLRFRNERLTQDLSEALALAHEENRAKNEFVANMSHELRTPLHGILGMSDMLLTQGPQPEATRNAGLVVIHRCGEHLLALINNILEFSRFGARGIELRPEAADLSRLLDETVQMCLPGALAKGLTLDGHIALPRPCTAQVDAFRLRQVLLNLLANAVKFTDHGGVQVHAQLDASGQGLWLRVEDSGVGIAPEVRDSIFEPFVQADSSSSRRFGGTGLGLSITRDLCRAMGGEVSYRSVVGQGSVFEVHLPLPGLLSPPATRQPPAPQAAPWVTAPTAPLSGTVLLAEDNEVNALVAEHTLRRFGLTVERVSTGVEVVQRVCQAQGRPDLVLLDCQMPEMDGFEAARRVRAHEAQHGLPRLALIALTANVFPEDRQQCQAAGMDDLVAKPFSTEQLHAMLLRHLPLHNGMPPMANTDPQAANAQPR